MYLTNGGKLQAIKRYSTVTVRKGLLEGPKRSGLLEIRITSVRISGILLYLISNMHATWPAHCILLELIIIIIFGRECKPWSSKLFRSLWPSVTATLLRPNVFSHRHLLAVSLQDDRPIFTPHDNYKKLEFFRVITTGSVGIGTGAWCGLASEVHTSWRKTLRLLSKQHWHSSYS